jgi:asparagine synthase (glutamine-hydrolysing)
MCGINGFSWDNEDLIKKMNRVTKNRGPDDQGTYTDKNVSLGHTRLSIIDLSPKGHQPMSNEDGSIWITYNGEVYNYPELKGELIKKGHVFKSDTDTEVIIHAYEEFGLDFLNKFNGMWAFCIYDSNKDLLVLSRDQFGIKPLYYYVDPDHFIFSSMIAGILCHDVKTAPNERAIMEYLAFNLEDHKPYTFFQNINALKPDSMLLFDLKEKKYEIRKWYHFTAKKTDSDLSIHDTFINSVKRRTLSDVPVGSCLSGGVDSSAIVCTLDKLLGGTFYTFSLVSPGAKLDESKYIKEVGRLTNTIQFFTTIDEEKFLDELYDFVAAQEEPVTGMSPYAQYRVMKLAHDVKAKVLLDGQGGDEIFAGYVYYFSYYYYELFKNLRWYTLAKEMATYVNNFKNFYPVAMFLFMFMPGWTRYFLWKGFLNKWIDYGYLNKTCGKEKDPRWNKMGLNEALELTLFSTAIPHLLRWEDKNSMRWSIETRPPFLDPVLVESSLALGSDKKLKNGRTKMVFKEAMDQILPDMIKNRKDKIGFAAPVNEFFRNENIVDFANSIIYSDSFKSRPYWKWKNVEKIYLDHISKKVNAGDTIWKWINLELWLRMYFESPADNLPVKNYPLIARGE